MINGMSLLRLHFQRFGLLMRIGNRATSSSEGRKSNTEAMYFPSKKLKETPLDELAANKGRFQLNTGGQRMHHIYGQISLPWISNISWLLTDNSDGQHHIGLASQAFGSLRKDIFCYQFLKVVTRVQLFTAIVINLLL